MTHQRNTPEPDLTWTNFEGRHPGQPFLQEDPIYALSEEVVAAIMAEAPGFFTAEQVRFERDLARTTSHGFYLRRPIIGSDRVGFAAKDVRPYAAGWTPDTGALRLEEFITLANPQGESQQEDVLNWVRSVLTDQGTPTGTRELAQAIQDLLLGMRNSTDPKTYQTLREKQAQQRQALLQRRQEGYAGWLVLNKTYRDELEDLRRRCQRGMVEQGRFPCAGDYLFPPEPQVPARQSYGDRFQRFYQRWGLDRLLTADLGVAASGGHRPVPGFRIGRDSPDHRRGGALDPLAPPARGSDRFPGIARTVAGKVCAAAPGRLACACQGRA